jgi:hypothetical protein
VQQLQQHLVEQQQQQQQETEPEPVLEHINFWKEQETKAQHPERQVRALGGGREPLSHNEVCVGPAFSA